LVQRERELVDVNSKLADKVVELASAHEFLKESESRLNKALDYAPIPIMLRSENGDVLKISKMWTEITGYTIEDIPTVKEWTEKALEEDDASISYTIEETYTESHLQPEWEFKIKTKSGEERVWQYATANIGKDAEQNNIMFVAAKDVTERNFFEEDIKRQNNMLTSLLRLLPVGVLMIDSKTKAVLVINNAAEMLFRVENEEVKNLSELFKHITVRKFGTNAPYPPSEMPINAGGLGDVAHVEDVEIVFQDGEVKQLEINSALIVDDKGEVWASIVSILDITKRKKDELDLINAKEMAEFSSRSKSQFLANMSHEIRTPLNGIIGMTQLMNLTPLTNDQEEYLAITLSSSEALLTIINDILDYSKIESGKMKLEKIPFEFNQITIQLMHGEGLHFYGDPFKIRQVLTNLIGNAIKYTNEGSIKVSAHEAESRPNGKVVIEFCVEDTGIGIPQNNLSDIFNSFSQADNSNTRQYGGTGLGLAISRSLAELMNGEIWVTSTEGVGSQFYFTCELDRAEESECKETADNQVPSPIEKKEVSILLVEDDPTSRILIKKIGEKHHWRITMAFNGEEAIASLATSKYDLVLMDIQMPVMDGLKAMKMIREKPAYKDLPIIALTANALTEDRERYLESGMDDYLNKPVNLTKLSEIVDKWTRQR